MVDIYIRQNDVKSEPEVIIQGDWILTIEQAHTLLELHEDGLGILTDEEAVAIEHLLEGIR